MGGILLLALAYDVQANLLVGRCRLGTKVNDKRTSTQKEYKEKNIIWPVRPSSIFLYNLHFSDPPNTSPTIATAMSFSGPVRYAERRSFCKSMS